MSNYVRFNYNNKLTIREASLLMGVLNTIFTMRGDAKIFIYTSPHQRLTMQRALKKLERALVATEKRNEESRQRIIASSALSASTMKKSSVFEVSHGLIRPVILNEQN